MAKPVAVLISDIHFTPGTLELATASLKAAMSRAVELSVPLVVAGDTLDGKALMRGEVVNRLLDIFSGHIPETYMLVGNHCMLAEKADDDALHFLDHKVDVVRKPTTIPGLATLIPYQNSPEKMQEALNLASGSRIICHQGVQSAHMGHYVQDKTSLPPEAFKDFRTISGHYHRAQDIKCGPPRKGAVGLFSYIGNPYTLSFGEANDGPKGYCILMDNGLLERVPLNLRKHIIAECTAEQVMTAKCPFDGKNDLIWLKVSGTCSELDKLKKKEIADCYVGHSNFKLDKIYADAPKLEAKTEKLTDAEVLDAVIDNQDDSKEEKKYLKGLWREILK